MEVPTTLRCQTADMVLRRQQRELGLIPHALTTGLNDLEGASTHFLSAVEEIGEGPVRERLLQAHREMTQASTHALRMLGSRFNDAANKRRQNLALPISDKMLARKIRAAPLGYDSLLASSLQPAIQASTFRQQNNLLIGALRNTPRPATRRRSRSPVRRYQSQDGQQQQQTRQQQQPFRRGSRGFSRGSRGTRGTGGADLPSLEGCDSLGHLTERRDWWDSIARDSFVCEAVRGHRLEFESRPPVKKIKIKIKNSEKKKILQKEVDSLLTKGAIEVVRDSHKGFNSNLFLVTKKDGGFRPVINLSGLNHYMKKKTFRMATLKDVSQTLRQCDWASTIDLKDAYLHVPITKEHRRFLRFCWGGKEYQFRRLPFGLSSAPRTFTRLTLPLITLCRAKGVRVEVYLDDFLVLGRRRSELRRHTDFVLQTLREAGFQTNQKKCHLDPRQEFEYLGLLWNTRVLRVFLPEVKRAGFKQLGRNLLENPSLVVAQRCDLRMESSLSGKATLASFPDVSNQSPEVRPVTDGSRCRERGQMVDPATYRRFEGPFGVPVNDDGRFYSRMGCDVGPQVGQRSLVQEGDGSPYKPSGVTGGPEGITEFYPNVEEQSSALGQRDSSGVPDERGRYKIKSSERVDKRDPAVLQETQGNDCTSLPTGSSEPGRKCSVQRNRIQGMVPGPSSGEESVQTPRRARGGSVCIQPVSPSGEILHVRQEEQESRWDQCLRERVGLQAHVCIPTSSIDSSDSGQDERAQRDPDSDYSILDQSGMASGVDSHVNEATPSSTSTAVHCERSQHRQGSTISEQAQVNSLDYLRETFQEQGADQTLAEFICGSWRGSTKFQYACAWRTWSEWCGGYAVPRTQPTVDQFANYLWFLYQVKRMAWSTIRLHRAAVATIIEPLTRNPLSQHPLESTSVDS